MQADSCYLHNLHIQHPSIYIDVNAKSSTTVPYIMFHELNLQNLFNLSAVVKPA